VHRPRRDDWSLPKGKLDEGESWEQAALREVREETACEGRIVGFAGAVSYLARRAPKIVLYWHMALVREGRFEANEEIDEVAWLAPDAALKRVDYEGDRRLVRRSPPGGVPAERAGPGAAPLAAERADLMRRVLSLGPDAEAPALGPALELLDHADDALARGDARGGRALVAAARRLALLSSGKAERVARAKALREEAGRLAPWRRRAIRKLLPAGEDVSGEALYHATAIRDEEDEAEAAASAPSPRGPAALALAGGLALGAVAALAGAQGAPFVAGALAGLAGGTVAAAGVLAWSRSRDARSRGR
jgi:8-oxo-dGTP diphosphatase